MTQAVRRDANAKRLNTMRYAKANIATIQLKSTSARIRWRVRALRQTSALNSSENMGTGLDRGARCLLWDVNASNAVRWIQIKWARNANPV